LIIVNANLAEESFPTPYKIPAYNFRATAFEIYFKTQRYRDTESHRAISEFAHQKLVPG
jgi:hypothetical protein